jgi:hypothetical protein
MRLNVPTGTIRPTDRFQDDLWRLSGDRIQGINEDDEMPSTFFSAISSHIDSGALSAGYPQTETVDELLRALFRSRTSTVAARSISETERRSAIAKDKGFHEHANGGGLVADTAQVANEAYIDRNVVVLDGARIDREVRLFDQVRVFDFPELHGKIVVGGSEWIHRSMKISEPQPM